MAAIKSAAARAGDSDAFADYDCAGSLRAKGVWTAGSAYAHDSFGQFHLRREGRVLSSDANAVGSFVDVE
jgi:hypothetical protein